MLFQCVQCERELICFALFQFSPKKKPPTIEILISFILILSAVGCSMFNVAGCKVQQQQQQNG